MFEAHVEFNCPNCGVGLQVIPAIKKLEMDDDQLDIEFWPMRVEHMCNRIPRRPE
jgi:hypothetical protein